MLSEVVLDGTSSSRISSVILGGKSTSEGMGVTPSGKGYEERRCFPRSTDHDKKVPSILREKLLTMSCVVSAIEAKASKLPHIEMSDVFEVLTLLDAARLPHHEDRFLWLLIVQVFYAAYGLRSCI
jgi:hypothetical protein